MTAYQHAVKAGQLLESLTSLENEIHEAPLEDKLQMVASGGMARYNQDAQHTVQVAIAHALTGLALKLTPTSPHTPR